jgi:hypothetical protein
MGGGGGGKRGMLVKEEGTSGGCFSRMRIKTERHRMTCLARRGRRRRNQKGKSH